jgi:CheY-like chemotaxis protein
MKILIAEDCLDTALLYESLLKERNHEVIVTNDGEDCLKKYHEEYQKLRNYSDATAHKQPFDVALLDYKMPKINGMEVAKEILAVNPHQRIVFASAYVKETLIHSISQLKQLVEVLNKPFEEEVLIDTLEDKEIYNELQSILGVDVEDIKAANFRHEQMKDILEFLKTKRKKKTKKEKKGTNEYSG